MKKIIYTMILAAGVFSTTACVDELDQTPHTEITSGDVYTSAANYKSVLAKVYASYVIAGQEKGGGNKDIATTSGYDYMRCYFNMQECGTDEMASTWLEGDKVKDISYLTWDASDPWVSDTYYLIYQTIDYANEFLRNATDDNISKFSDSDRALIKQYRAEARFLRALSYYHAMDLYRNIPFVTEKDEVGSFTPPRYTSSQIFDYIESELKDIDGDLLDRSEAEYGRATKGAAWTLLAKMYLNAEIYTGKARYSDCITYCNKVIGDGYSLEGDYSKLFNADNQKRTNEIIFPLSVDATHTVSWGATTYIVCGEVDGNSSENPLTYGVKSAWSMFRLRGELTSLFASGDKRAMFYTKGQSQYLDTGIDTQTNGYLMTKYRNLLDNDSVASNTASYGASIDFPMFRLADVYLMYAESVVRGGDGGSIGTALGYINKLRERAYGSTDGDVKTTDLTKNFILDERARELYMEGTRRTDLIRYGKFTTSDYLWQWKGGVKDGKAVNSKYNYYPIPQTELTANPNLHNDNY
ncbi:RagB/SusD family nutrient uptake outer membrane protein [Xylanibacter oryzae]|uniref:RagB/SusD family nutrient uptake outer membrane protein n=1 Tax=Xylanibacter oryzae TaxID=185293 RepID=UPI00055D4D27|nr:RagB/SusD family nutrient uptake outer membrane protein [Xylanibacter oryzae]